MAGVAYEGKEMDIKEIQSIEVVFLNISSESKSDRRVQMCVCVREREERGGSGRERERDECLSKLERERWE